MRIILVHFKVFLIALFCNLFTGCDNFLEEEVFSEYDPSSFLKTREGINSLLVSSYKYLHVTGYNQRERMYTYNEFPADAMWDWGGGFEAIASNYMNFNWNSQTPQFRNTWQGLYTGIRNANSILDNIDLVQSLSPDDVKQFKAEAIFIRATSYYCLWELFGPTPLITTASTIDVAPSRPTDQEFDDFITVELGLAANDLPVSQDLWGKGTKGAALAFLGRYYLNSKQWEKAAGIYKEVMELNEYDLFQGDLTTMFAVENEMNDEVIFTSPALPTLNGNDYMAHAFPPSYPTTSTNFATQFVVRESFWSTYDAADKRLGWMLFDYTGLDGVRYSLREPTGFGVRCFKYPPDPGALGVRHGNDVPMIRYAEILLNRAEALNEINGPTQESIDLINMIRSRADVELYDISDFPSKDALRDAILNELAWEFIAEGRRRVDLIRHNKLIPFAIARGVSHAKDYMSRFPIPENEINANPNLEQNPGY